MENLIIYYSRKGQNYVSGSIKNLAKGNTEIVAEFIKKAVGGDMFEVETAKAYSDDYYKCIEEAKDELNEKARPKLKKILAGVEEYDTIFIGYPNWWGTCPMAIFSVLEPIDLTGKKIVPFCTNEGSGMGSSEQDLKEACPKAVFAKGLSIHGAEAAASEKAVSSWLRNL